MSLGLQPWTRQPTGAPFLDRDNPLVGLFDNLVLLTPTGYQRNLANPGFPVTKTGVDFASGLGGQGVGVPSAGYVNLGQVGNYASGGMFIAMTFTATPGTVAAQPIIAYKGQVSNPGWSLQILNTGVLSFAIGTTAVFVLTGAGAIVDGGTYTVIVTGASGTQNWSIYVNGVERSSMPGFAATVGSSSDDLTLLAYNKTLLYFAGPMYWFGSGPNYLTAEQAVRLSQNPWQLYQPNRPLTRKAFIAPSTTTPSGVGAGTFPKLTGAGTGTQSQTGTGAGTFPKFTGAATGTVTPPLPVGVGAGIFPALTGAAVGVAPEILVIHTEALSLEGASLAALTLHGGGEAVTLAGASESSATLRIAH